MRGFLLGIFWRFAPLRPFLRKRLPKHTRGYAHYWQSETGSAYRQAMYERQRNMDANPTFEEMRAEIAKYAPESVLNVGCGYGREVLALAPHFNIEGCDIAADLLAKVPAPLKVFKFDILKDLPEKKWDVVFCRAVTMYFPQEEELRTVMKNMETMAEKKVLVWEWPHIITTMQKAYPSPKFEYHPLAYRDE